MFEFAVSEIESREFIDWIASKNPEPKPVVMTDAEVFRDLLTAWHHDATSDRVDVLASELAARLAQANHSLCVALMTVDSICTLFGLIYFLDGYGIILRQRYRANRDGVFVYVDRKTDKPSEFAGQMVFEFDKKKELANAY
jgi:hypothetical protein